MKIETRIGNPNSGTQVNLGQVNINQSLNRIIEIDIKDDNNVQKNQIWIEFDEKGRIQYFENSGINYSAEDLEKSLEKMADKNDTEYECPHCHHTLNFKYAYCPFCGQKLTYSKKGS